MNVAHTELDLARPKENIGKKGFTNEERTGIDNVIKKGFVDAFRILTKSGGHYTWWSYRAKNARERNIGRRIDYFMVSKSLKDRLISCEILREAKHSDHCPVKLYFDL